MYTPHWLFLCVLRCTFFFIQLTQGINFAIQPAKSINNTMTVLPSSKLSVNKINIDGDDIGSGVVGGGSGSGSRAQCIARAMVSCRSFNLSFNYRKI